MRRLRRHTTWALFRCEYSYPTELKIELANYQRITVTSNEATSLPRGSWLGIAKGFELIGYCHECDDAEATGTVDNYFLDLSNRCITAEVKYKCCGSESTISFGGLDEKLVAKILATRGR